MKVNKNSSQQMHHLPGLAHQTLAGEKDGLGQFEVWRQTIDAHAATPVHRHDCEEVIMCSTGKGVCKFEDKEVFFGADETLLIPANVVHQICNAGDEDLNIVATLAMAPVEVFDEHNQPMPLPWG
ncbi:MAG: cupin domain-containing protein [Pseudomonadota bacterium]